MAGKKQNLAPMWKKLMQNVDIDEPTSFSWPRAFGMHSTGMQTTWGHILNSTQKCSNHVFLLEQQKNYRDVRNLTRIQWRGPTTWKDGHAQKMRWAIPWIGKQESRVTLQGFSSLFGRPSVQKRGIGISWRIVRYNLSWNACMKWTTWHLGGPWKNWQDQSQNGLRHVTNDWQSWFHMFITQMTIVNIVMWETRHSTADLVISRLRLCRRPWGFKVNLRRCLVYYWKQNICSSQLDVQETNISFS